MNTHNTYGFEEAEALQTFASQANFNFDKVKNVDVALEDQQSFKTENGQPLVDLVTPKYIA